MRVEELFRASVVYRAVNRVIQLAQTAWVSSSARGLLSGAAGDHARFSAAVVLVGSLTALVLIPVGTTPRPLAWLVPSVVAVAAMATLFVAKRTSSH